jgi:regulatory protein
MIITEITNCKKNKNRVNVFVDGTFAFALYLETAMQYGLKKDMDITGLNLKKIAEDDEKKYSIDAALKFISYQMRSKNEVYKKLKQKGVSDKSSEETIQRLEELGYLNDRAYAETYAAELKDRMGNRGIAHKLYEKGIDKELAEEVLQNLGSFSGTAKEQAKRLFEKYKDLDRKKAREKVFRTLMSRGFEVEDIRYAIKECGAEENNYEEI